MVEAYAHPRCYASSRNDCTRKISGEHPISDGVLALIDNGGGLTVDGFPGSARRTGVRAHHEFFKRRILCTRHNSLMSPLDSAAKELLEGVMTAANYALRRGALWFSLDADGAKFERWCLKAACGLYVAKRRAEGESSAVPESALKVLFGEAPMPRTGGCYLMPAASGLQIAALSFRAMHVNDCFAEMPVAFDVRGCGVHLRVFFNEVSNQQPEVHGAIHRVGSIAYSPQGASNQLRIDFSWDPRLPSNADLVVFRNVAVSPSLSVAREDQ
jgi:hypothetical protein